MEVKDHYEKHLGHFYSWMFGDFESKVKDNLEFFSSQHIIPQYNKVCFDLGAGSGFQSIALAKQGFEVFAIDFSNTLLEELQAKKEDLPVRTVLTDILQMDSYPKSQPELVVCMGDTLTHLPDKTSIDKLFVNTFNILAENGLFILSFRELTFELEGEKRFIPVKSDSERILTCFLEYFPEFVRVHDILHEFNPKTGRWDQKISWYPKLRISKSEIENALLKAGFQIVFSEIMKGFVTIISKRFFQKMN
jgi:SAM-dependent methyltransferase